MTTPRLMAIIADLRKPDIAVEEVVDCLNRFVSIYSRPSDEENEIIEFWGSLIQMLRSRRRLSLETVRAFTEQLQAISERPFGGEALNGLRDLLLRIVKVHLGLAPHFETASRQKPEHIYPRVSVGQEQALSGLSRAAPLSVRRVVGTAKENVRSERSSIGLPKQPPRVGAARQGSLANVVSRSGNGTLPTAGGPRGGVRKALIYHDLANSLFEERDLHVHLGVSSDALELRHGHTLFHVATRENQAPQDAARLSLQAAKILHGKVSSQDEQFIFYSAFYAQFSGRRYQREHPRNDTSAVEYFLEALDWLERHPLRVKRRYEEPRVATVSNLLTSLVCLHDPRFAASRENQFERPLKHVFIDSEQSLEQLYGAVEGQKKFRALVRDVIIGLVRIRHINVDRWERTVMVSPDVREAMLRCIRQFAGDWFPGYRPTPGQGYAARFAELEEQLQQADKRLFEYCQTYLTATLDTIGQHSDALTTLLFPFKTNSWHLLERDQQHLTQMTAYVGCINEYFSAEMFVSRRGAYQKASAIRAALMSAIRETPTRLSVGLILPVLEHGWKLLDADFAERRSSAAPRLEVRLLKNELSLLVGAEESRTVEVQLQVANEGYDAAKEVQVEVETVGESAATVVDTLVSLHSIEGKYWKVFTVSIQLSSSLKSLLLSIELSYRYDGQYISLPTEHLEIAHSNPQDLTPLVKGSVQPYTLDAISDPSRLRGRRVQMERLEDWLRTATQSPVILHGQRRVGKSSVGIVFREKVQALISDNVVCYFEWQLYGDSPLWSIILGILEDQVEPALRTKFGRGMPELPGIRELREDPLGSFKRYLSKAIRVRPGIRFLFIIDEFDAVTISLQKGHISRSFFSWLRGFMNLEGMRFVFIGGEAMPNLLSEYGDEFNRSIPYVIDHLSEAHAAELIAEPVQGYLSFSPASLNRIFEYCDGNPYYSTIVAQETLIVMSEKKQGHVSIIDIEQAIKRVLQSLDESKFSHYWRGNNTEYDVLRAVADASYREAKGRTLFFTEFVPISRIKESPSVRSMDEATLLSVLDAQCSRRVLLRDKFDNGYGYRIRVGLFAAWFIERGNLRFHGVDEVNTSVWEGVGGVAQSQVLLGQDSELRN